MLRNEASAMMMDDRYAPDSSPADQNDKSKKPLFLAKTLIALLRKY
jgi:hypothetical protein